MKKLRNNVLFYILPLSCFLACKETECENTNPIFNQLQPNDKAYKEALAKEISKENTQNLTYLFEKTYQKEGGREFIEVQIQGKGLCAKAEMMVSEWGKLSGIKQSNGGGYKGAELKGLKMEIGRNADSSIQFIYVDMQRILD